MVILPLLQIQVVRKKICHLVVKKCALSIGHLPQRDLPKYLSVNLVFSSPVRKYRKSYCSHPGVSVSVSEGVSVGVAQNVKVFG